MKLMLIRILDSFYKKLKKNINSKKQDGRLANIPVSRRTFYYVRTKMTVIVTTKRNDMVKLASTFNTKSLLLNN